MFFRSQIVEPDEKDQRTIHNPIKLWILAGRLYLCQAMWIKRGQFKASMRSETTSSSGY